VRRKRADLDESELEAFLDRSQLGLHTLESTLGLAFLAWESGELPRLLLPG
jgi:hypothetical protein